MNLADVLIIGCSPRDGGNSDIAVHETARSAVSIGLSVEKLFLRDFRIIPCKGCRICAQSPDFRCVLSDLDQGRLILEKIDLARVVCFCSPIFFYHLPAQFKALIDRSQSYYERWIATGNQKADRKALCILVAGRKKGDALFRGSLLTLKYFLDPFNRKISELSLRGKDGRNDLKKDTAARLQVSDFILRELENS